MKISSLLGLALLIPGVATTQLANAQSNAPRTASASVSAPQLSLWTATFSAKLNENLERRSQVGIQVALPASSAEFVTVEVALPKRAPQSVTLRRADSAGTLYRGVINVTKPGKLNVSYGAGAERQEKRTFIRWPVVG